MDAVRDVPSAFLSIGLKGFGLLLLVGLLLSGVAVPASALFGLDWLTLTTLIGGFIGLVAGLIMLYAIRAALAALQQAFEHELEMDTRAREPEPPFVAPAVQPPAPSPSLAVETTNQANEDWKTALAILEATFKELGKVQDGEKLQGKPFAYDRCAAAGLVTRWEQWKRVMDLLQDAGIGENLAHPKRWKFNVGTFEASQERLREHYTHAGFIKVNGVWQRR